MRRPLTPKMSDKMPPSRRPSWSRVLWTRLRVRLRSARDPKQIELRNTERFECVGRSYARLAALPLDGLNVTDDLMQALVCLSSTGWENVGKDEKGRELWRFNPSPIR